MVRLDLAELSLREVNGQLQSLDAGVNDLDWRIANPLGAHAVAVGLTAPIRLTIEGQLGFYCGGMNQNAEITIDGHAGPGATGHGGLLVVEGDASSRCGISMKGIDIVVKGSVGHMSAFMAQKGHLVVCGDAGRDLGDSIHEATLFIRGKAESLGADCVGKEMRPEHREVLARLLAEAGVEANPSEFQRYGSARKLYNFNIDHADQY